MNKLRKWFWEIEEQGQGPDYVFLATFDSSDATQLANLVRKYPLYDFQYDADAQSSRDHKCKIYDRYYDSHTYSRLTAMRVSGTQENIYYYTEIEVCDNNFAIERVLGGSVYTSQPQNETNLITMLARSPNLTLTEWKVAYNGYSWGLVRGGNSAEELLKYLQT